jgi:DNA-binding transcriptional regulator of glucitol operon
MKWPVVLVIVILLGGQKMFVVWWQIRNYKNKTCVNANNCNKMNESKQ